MFASSGEAIPRCGVPVIVSLQATGLGHHARFEKPAHEPQDALIGDPS
jgi:hypothetical protein